MENENLVNIQNAQIEFPIRYKNWFERFCRVFSAYIFKLITDNIEPYQLFILEFGQFNANFTLEELKRLDYPFTPFAIMHQHTYLRSVDTLAMDILRVKYQEEKFNTKLYPIWLDSELFWQELKRYCTVITILPDKPLDKNLLNEIPYKTRTLWVNLDSPKQRDQIAKQFEDLLLKRRLEEVVPVEIRPLFDSNNKSKIDKAHENLLCSFFAEEVEKIQSKKRKEAQAKLISSDRNDKWFGTVMSIARKAGVSFPLPSIKSLKELKDYASSSNNVLSFDIFLKNISLKLSNTNFVETKDYTILIAQWVKDELKSIKKNAVYFFKDKYQDVETIVFVNCEGVERDNWFPKSIINTLGYRLDPVKANRILLHNFPQLFVNIEQTQRFWRYLEQTQQFKRLPETEQTAIRQLGQKVITQLHTPPTIYPPLSNFDNELDKLTNLPISKDNEFKIFNDFLTKCLLKYRENNPNFINFNFIVNAEIKRNLSMYLHAYQQADTAIAVRCVQTIAEILILKLRLNPLAKLLPELIYKDYLGKFPVQSVLITPYAMRAFTHVFQLLDSLYHNRSPKIYVTIQSYFEWLQALERLNNRDTTVLAVQDLAEIDESAEIIFIEIHPNSVTANKQFAHEITELITSMNKPAWQDKQRTLVIDLTLNALNDPEIQQLLIQLSTFINLGLLNLILIQSLTKFSQIGLDLRSGGIITTLNNGKHWTKVNAKATEIEKKKFVDYSTLNFFSFFFSFNTLIKDYLASINSNVQFVYQQILKNFDNLEVSNQRRLQITTSSDPKACYVALNMHGLLPAVDSGYKYRISDIEKFSRDLLIYLILPLCEFLKLPLTERMSIGFPLSSVNCVFDSLRFTIGLEAVMQLRQYAAIFTYTAFIINRQRDLQIFFIENDNGLFNLRINFFKEKVNQFKAMLPGSRHSYTITHPSGEIYFDTITNVQHDLKIDIILSNGCMTIYRERGNHPPEGNGTQMVSYNENHIYIPIRNIGNTPFSDSNLNTLQRQIIAACTTSVIQQDQKILHNVNIQFDNFSGNVHFSSYSYLNYWMEKFVYGPFYINGIPSFFLLYQNIITIIYNGYFYLDQAVLVKKDNIRLPLASLPIEEKEYFIREGNYEPDRSAQQFRRLYPNFGWPSMQFIPFNRQVYSMTIDDRKFVIELDRICCRLPGFKIYKRYIDRSLTAIEIDYWQEKEPHLSRFLSLMIAILVKDREEVSFLARNPIFSQFLFNLYYEVVDEIFNSAASLVISKKPQLKQILDNYERPEYSSQFSFFHNNNILSWPSGYSGCQYIKDGELIKKSMAILKL